VSATFWDGDPLVYTLNCLAAMFSAPAAVTAAFPEMTNCSPPVHTELEAVSRDNVTDWGWRVGPP
jgi:hypothetical protein